MFLSKKASKVHRSLEDGIALGCMNPIFFMTSTSQRLDTRICPICCAAMRRLHTGIGAFLIGCFCFGGEAIRGDLRLRLMSLVNLVRRRAASPVDGVASLAEAADLGSADAGWLLANGPRVIMFLRASWDAGVLASTVWVVSPHTGCMSPPIAFVLSCGLTGPSLQVTCRGHRDGTSRCGQGRN